MSKYYCNQDAENLVKLEIKNRKEALKLYDGIIETAVKFDGKILNKRFETALKKVDERLSCERNYSWFEINFCDWDNRSCQSVKKDSLGYSHTLYLSNFELRLNSYLQTYSTSGESFLNEERIIASVLIESLKSGKEKIEKDIERLENSIDKVDAWKEKLKELKIEMEKTMEEIPYIIRDYYDINYRVENR